MKTIFCIIVISFLVISSTLSQPEEANNGINHAYISAIAEDPENNILYAGTFGGGIYKSTDNGNSWMEVNDGLTDNDLIISSIIICDGKVFAGSEKHVFLSVDQGENWTNVSNGLQVTGETYINVLFTDGEYVYAGTSEGLFRSADGSIWVVPGSGIPEQSISSIVMIGPNIFASTQYYGVFLSTDDGASWTAVNNGLADGEGNPYEVSSMGFRGSFLFAATDHGMYITTDNGVNWTYAGTGLPDVNVTTIVSSGSSVLAGTEENGVFKSVNDGSSWLPSNTGLTGPWVSKLIISGTNIIAGTYGGAFFSTDNGDTWTKRNQGFKNVWTTAVVTSGTNVVAATYIAGIYLSSDYGDNWSPSSTGITNSMISCLASNGSKVFAGTEGGGVFYSANNGSTWSQVNTGLTDLNVHAIATDGTNTYAGTDNGVFFTSDNGSSWVAKNNGLIGNSIYFISIAGTRVFTECNGLYISTNKGDNWILVSENISPNSILLVGSDLYAGTNNGVHISHDNGANWTVSSTGLPKNPNVASLSLSGTSIFAGIKSGQFSGAITGLYVSLDAGNYWSVVNGSEDLAVTSTVVCGGELIAGTEYRGLWKETISEIKILTVSTDLINVESTESTVDFGLVSNTNWTVTSSESWLVPDKTGGTGNTTITLTAGENRSEYSREAIVSISAEGLDTRNILVSQSGICFWQQSNGNLYGANYIYTNAVLVDPETDYLFAATHSGVYVSRDKGSSWEMTIRGLTNLTVSALGVNGQYLFAGTGGGIFISTDKGKSWKPSNNGLSITGHIIRSIKIINAKVYLATSGGIFISSDNGSSWTAKNNGIPTAVNDLLIKGSTIYAAVFGRGIYVSTDNGDSWTAMSNGLTGNALYAQSIIENEGRLFIGTQDGVYVSDDNGINWTAANNGITSQYIKSLTFLGSYVYAVGNRVYMSDDNGETWIQTSNNPGNAISVYEDYRLLLATPYGVSVSSDLGFNFEPLTSNILSGVSIKSFALDGDKIFAATVEKGVLLSDDDGETWISKSDAQFINARAVVVKGSKLFAGTTGGIYYTENGGDTWQWDMDGFTTSSVNALAVADDKIFAGTAIGGMYMSEDDGDNWIEVNTGLSGNALRINAITVFGSDVYIGTHGAGVYKSNNYGTTWTPVNIGPNALFINTFLVDGVNIFSGTSAGLYVSPDNGNTWTLNFPNSINSVTRTGEKLFIGTSTGVYISLDNGDTWRSFNSGLPNLPVQTLFPTPDFIFAGTMYTGFWKQKLSEMSILHASPGIVHMENTENSTAIFKIFSNTSWSVNNHEPWLTPDKTEGTGNATITLTALDNTLNRPKEAFITISGSGSGNKTISVIQKGVSEWQEVNNNISGGMITFLKPDPSAGKLYAAVQGAGIFISSDNGVSWTSRNNGLTDKYINTIGIKGSKIYAGGNTEGIFVSDDNGLNWSIANNGLTNKIVKSIVSTSTGVFAGTLGGIFLSVDNGDTWVSVNSGLSENQKRVNALVIKDSYIFAATSSGIIRSADDGSTWTASNNGMTLSYNILCFIADGSNLYAGTSGGGIYLSSNNGDNWTAVNNGIPLQIQVINGMVATGTGVYSGTIGGVYFTNDNGATWTLSGSLPYPSIRSLTFSESKLFAGTTAGVFVSSDYGSNWSFSSDGLNGSSITSILEKDENIIVTSLNGIFKSADNGDTWEEINNGLTAGSVYSVISTGSRIFAGTASGVFRSDDDGDNWAFSSNGITTNIIRTMAYNGTQIYAGTDKGIFVSDDNGLNWSPMNNGLNSSTSTVFSIAFYGQDIYIGTNGTGVFLMKSGWDGWIPVNTGLPQNSNYITSTVIINDKIFIGTFSGMFKSSVNNISWSEMTTGISSGYNIKSLKVKDNIMYAGMIGGVYFSNDYGNTWAPMNNGLSVYNLHVNSIGTSQNYLFAGTNYNGVWRHLNSDKYISVSSSVISIDESESSTGNFDITSNTEWDISCAEDWLNISPATGSFNFPVILTAEANPLTSERIAFITIEGTAAASKTVIVTQRNGITTRIPDTEDPDIRIYPNPVNDRLYITGLPENSGIKIYDFQGKAKLSIETLEGMIDLSTLVSGIYTLRIEINDRFVFKRFIKK